MPMRGLRCLNLLLAMMLLGPLCLGKASAYTLADYYHCTHDQVIAEALGDLEHSTQKETVRYLIENEGHVLFKDMRELGPQYLNHDALSVITDDDHHIIYINEKHRSAPAPALAAIISHEAMHSDRENSIQEEISAWHQEAKTWQEMLIQYPALKSVAVGQCPLMDRLNAIALLIEHHQLESEIETNVAYHGLPEHSPGF